MPAIIEIFIHFKVPSCIPVVGVMYPQECCARSIVSSCVAAPFLAIDIFSECTLDVCDRDSSLMII